ncbi:hypothetical protein EON64_13590 [archaeon]|nr:MAG: hypothetical protein EON64_13590 [archaeon]
MVPLVTGFYSEISVENPVGPVVRSLCVARDELLHLIKADVALSVQQHMRIEYLSKVLEKCHIPIQTVPFYNLATQGCWRQVYSNVLLRKPVPQMRCNLTQTILPAEAASLSGSLVNSVFYSYDVPGVQVYTGKLDVQCEYACNSRGEVQVTLQGHVMLADDHVPEDTEGFLLDLQRSVPYDTFDPSNSTQKLLVSANQSWKHIKTEKYCTL